MATVAIAYPSDIAAIILAHIVCPCSIVGRIVDRDTCTIEGIIFKLRCTARKGQGNAAVVKYTMPQRGQRRRQGHFGNVRTVKGIVADGGQGIGQGDGRRAAFIEGIGRNGGNTAANFDRSDLRRNDLIGNRITVPGEIPDVVAGHFTCAGDGQCTLSGEFPDQIVAMGAHDSACRWQREGHIVAALHTTNGLTAGSHTGGSIAVFCIDLAIGLHDSLGHGAVIGDHPDRIKVKGRECFFHIVLACAGCFVFIFAGAVMEPITVTKSIIDSAAVISAGHCCRQTRRRPRNHTDPYIIAAAIDLAVKAAIVYGVAGGNTARKGTQIMTGAESPDNGVTVATANGTAVVAHNAAHLVKIVAC